MVKWEAGTFRYRVEVYDAGTGGLVGTVPWFEERHVPAVALSPDARRLVLYAASAGKMTVYDIPAGQLSGAAVASAERSPEATGGAPAPGSRLAVPAADALTKAEAEVREVFKDDYARKKESDKKALAQKLIKAAEGTADDAAARYVMLRDARDLAAEVGEVVLAVQAIDGLAKWYEVDPAAAKLAVIDKVLPGTTYNATLRAIHEQAVAGADAAFDADNFADAEKLAQAAATAAKKGGLGQAAIEDAAFRLDHLKKTRDAFDAARPALEKLRTAPDDPDANLAAGKFRCFVQGRWADGVKLLAKGSNAALKQAAEQEVAVPSPGPAEVKVADAWWDFARDAPDAEKRVAEARARYWYGRAVAGLTGLAKAKVEGRLTFTHNGVEYRSGLVAVFESKQPAVLKGKKARIDPVIDFSGGEFAAGGKDTDVKVTWTGVVLPPRPGRYKLVASGSDSVRVRLDGKPLIDTYAKRSAPREGSVLLQDRPAALVVEYTGPNTNAHGLKLTWVPAGGGGEEAVPAEALFHDRKAESVLGK
jgi:hypothetical protein